jgi:hypothetical protein
MEIRPEVGPTKPDCGIPSQFEFITGSTLAEVNTSAEPALKRVERTVVANTRNEPRPFAAKNSGP